ncbi:MAG: MarC family protein, partial [Terriglobales bacterium]
MAPLLILLKFLPLGFSALLPLINPVGSALVLLGMVGPQPVGVYRELAAKIARNTVLLLIAVDLVGTLVLR